MKKSQFLKECCKMKGAEILRVTQVNKFLVVTTHFKPPEYDEYIATEIYRDDYRSLYDREYKTLKTAKKNHSKIVARLRKNKITLDYGE